jgi:hypothetical protein
VSPRPRRTAHATKRPKPKPNQSLITACVFCGGTPLHYEHVWPKWLLKEVFPPNFKARKAYGRYPGLQSFNAKSVAVKLALVCQPVCNGGWMKQLEDNAKPLLRPWIKGSRQDPDLEQQRCLAAWAVKTVMMLQFTQDVLPIPPRHFKQLFARQTSPPDGTYVFIATDPGPQSLPRALFRIRFLGFQTDDYSKLAPRRVMYPGYEATLVVQHLVIVVVGHAGPATLQAQRFFGFNEAANLRRIWPSVASRGVVLPTRD